jgi:hypothetical protein
VLFLGKPQQEAGVAVLLNMKVLVVTVVLVVGVLPAQ